MGSDTKYRVAEAFIFRPHGSRRLGEAAFILIWLCMWAVGEGFALFVLGQGLWALLTGLPVRGFDAPVRLVPVLAAGAFLFTTGCPPKRRNRLKSPP